MHVPIDYDILRFIWWALLGVLLIAFAVMDGFDLGVGVLLPFVGRSDTERRVAINAIGPVWEGNQVWFILGGGAAFAAWPPLYAVSFSGLYVAMILVLATLILRPVAITFRGKIDDARWRGLCDWALFAAGIVPALVFGVAIGNLLLGLPFRLDDTMRMAWQGGFFDLLAPFPILCGLVSVAMVVMHGGVFLALKSDGRVAERASQFAVRAAAAVVVLFGVAGIWVAFGMDGYAITSGAAHNAASNPLAKDVAVRAGAWLANYRIHAWLLAAPALGFVGALLASLALMIERPGLGFVASGASVSGIVATAGVSLFPFLMPSSLDPRSSLTVWDASSSQLTLFLMLVAAAIFVPAIIVYTGWVFRVLRGKVSASAIESGRDASY
ncbi:MAG TPA: cytochrome d ubiquinol oxidase subunit II [Candidatus Cybelea sp.]|nr:cytochrome d ubiquinol oxidase subunit II [Candidatus Cybelea sp.]